MEGYFKNEGIFSSELQDVMQYLMLKMCIVLKFVKFELKFEIVSKQ